MTMELTVIRERWPIQGLFTISRGSKTHADVIVVELYQQGSVGRGECVPYARYQESLDSVVLQIESIKPRLEAGLTHEQLLSWLPAGAARNAIDCALWDLECKLARQTIWQRLNRPAPRVLTTAYTLSLDTPEHMEQAAFKNAYRPLLKLKLAGQDDIARVAAVRRGAPDARIIVDANESWDQSHYLAFIPELVKLNVEMVEQPFPAGQDGLLAELPHPIPICADESCHDHHHFADLIACYDMINIKLDKTGGLTEALILLDAARQANMAVMVGCMVGTSLSMAPAFVVAQQAQIVDLDGPLLLASDRECACHYQASFMHIPSPQLWG